MRALWIAALALVLPARLAAAQESRDTAVVAGSNLFHSSDLYVMGAFAGGTIAMFPLDRRLASTVRNERLVTNSDLRRVSHALNFLGSAGAVVIGGAMYVAGRYGGVPRVAHLAVHGTEAVVIGIAVAGGTKALLGRARPDETADTNPRSFAFARGFRGSPWQSFPSAHTTTAFAVAATVSGETAEWWPRSKWIIGPIMYGGAALIGLSRMYDDKHWASDVVMGAAIGTFSGLKVVRFNHTHAGNRLDRWLLGKDAASRAVLRVRPGVDGTLLLGLDVGR